MDRDQGNYFSSQEGRILIQQHIEVEPLNSQTQKM